MTGQPSLTRVEDALSELLSHCSPGGGTEAIALDRARARILAADHTAPSDVPAWDNSAMDGYTLAASSCSGASCRLRISQRIPAGSAAPALEPGTAARIFTGAPLPEGADAVVMQENCREQDGAVEILQAVSAGQNVRRAGSDMSKGQTLMPAGRRLRAADLGLLAGTGLARVSVHRRLRVALLATGDELVAPGGPLREGQIYNSNAYTLAALLEALGVECIDAGVVGDDLQRTTEAIGELAEQADCVITTGGVSVGEEDHVRAAVERLGSLSIWKLALKPGKPFAFGHVGQTPFFGLPGNPVSVFVTFVLLVRPCLLKMSGASECLPRSVRLPAGFDAPRSGDREEYLRVSLGEGEGAGQLLPFRSQSSGLLSSLSHSDGLAVVPPRTAVNRGDLLRFLSFDAIVN